MRRGAATWIQRTRLDVALRYVWEALVAHGLAYTMVPPSWYNGQTRPADDRGKTGPARASQEACPPGNRQWPAAGAVGRDECLSQQEREVWTQLLERLR